MNRLAQYDRHRFVCFTAKRYENMAIAATVRTLHSRATATPTLTPASRGLPPVVYRTQQTNLAFGSLERRALRMDTSRLFVHHFVAGFATDFPNGVRHWVQNKRTHKKFCGGRRLTSIN